MREFLEFLRLILIIDLSKLVKQLRGFKYIKKQQVKQAEQENVKYDELGNIYYIKKEV